MCVSNTVIYTYIYIHFCFLLLFFFLILEALLYLVGGIGGNILQFAAKLLVRSSCIKSPCKSSK